MRSDEFYEYNRLENKFTSELDNLVGYEGLRDERIFPFVCRGYPRDHSVTIIAEQHFNPTEMWRNYTHVGERYDRPMSWLDYWNEEESGFDYDRFIKDYLYPYVYHPSWEWCIFDTIRSFGIEAVETYWKSRSGWRYPKDNYYDVIAFLLRNMRKLLLSNSLRFEVTGRYHISRRQHLLD